MTIFKLVIGVFSLFSIGLLAFSFFVDHTSELYRLLNYFDFGFCVLFLYDFFSELYRAEKRWKYFFTHGWLDLLSAIPVIHEFRFVRIFRVFRIVRLIKSYREFRIFIKFEKKSSIYASILVVITFIIVSTSFLVLYLEKDVGNIKTAEDTLWWAYITVTTVGYGDYYPVTLPGKGVASLLIFTGFIAFGTVISFVNDRLSRIKDI
jgi:voltage-gated potassium channel